MDITNNPKILEMLGLETLETRNMDKLDFHDMSVWRIAEALEYAYSLGYNEGCSAGAAVARISG